MEERAGRKRIVLIDPKTKKILLDPQRGIDDLQRKLREAALHEGKMAKVKRWNVPNGHGPIAVEDQNTDVFFREMTRLILEHKSFMDKKGFIEDVQSTINEKLSLAEGRIEQVIWGLAIPKRKSKILIDSLIKKLRNEMERCLKKPTNRIDPTVNEVVCMNPHSGLWKKRENDLIKRIVKLYAEYTPLKGNVLQITGNLDLISKACCIFDFGDEALRKKIARTLPT